MAITDVLEDASHEVWAKLILNTHIVTTRTYLSRNMKSVKPPIRNACVQRLVEMGLFAERDDILTGRTHAFLKSPPINVDVQHTLLYFKINIADYEASFNDGNSFMYTGATNVIERAQIKRPTKLKAKFTSLFHRLINSDKWYGQYLFLADADVETVNDVQPLSMSSSTSTLLDVWL